MRAHMCCRTKLLSCLRQSVMTCPPAVLVCDRLHTWLQCLLVCLHTCSCCREARNPLCYRGVCMFFDCGRTFGACGHEVTRLRLHTHLCLRRQESMVAAPRRCLCFDCTHARPPVLCRTREAKVTVRFRFFCGVVGKHTCVCGRSKRRPGLLRKQGTRQSSGLQEPLNPQPKP